VSRILIAALLASAGFAAQSARSAPAPAQGPASQAPAADPRVPPVNRDLLHVQVILDKLGFGPGVLDGRPGLALTNAVSGFQESRGLPVTGRPDAATLKALSQYRQVRPMKRIVLTPAMLAGPYVNPIPRDEEQQARLPALAYRTQLEKLGEMFHTTPQVLIALNSPGTRLAPGTAIVVPNALPGSRDYDPELRDDWRRTLSDLNVDARQPRAARIEVLKSRGVLRVFDDRDRLVAQFTATMGSTHDPLPLGRWTVKGRSYNPPFHFNPDLFWDASDDAEKAKLPPGPNGPVGVVWMDLSKPHYGIHGTPEPQLIGRTESHGCVRLTNWDAARLAVMVRPGTPAVFRA